MTEALKDTQRLLDEAVDEEVSMQATTQHGEAAQRTDALELTRRDKRTDALELTQRDN